MQLYSVEQRHSLSELKSSHGHLRNVTGTLCLHADGYVIVTESNVLLSILIYQDNDAMSDRRCECDDVGENDEALLVSTRHANII